MKPLPHVHTPCWKGQAVLFDLDGVLVDTMPLHRQAFLTALAVNGLAITPEEHDAELGGLPTRVKVQRLIKQGRLVADQFDAVMEHKQDLTRHLIEARIEPRQDLCDLVQDLSHRGYALGVVSNAIAPTVTRILQLANLVWPMAVILSNEHVTRPKPAPDPWVIAMYELGAKPEQTWIVEDSPPGLESARASGAHVIEVSSPVETATAVRSVLL